MFGVVLFSVYVVLLRCILVVMFTFCVVLCTCGAVLFSFLVVLFVFPTGLVYCFGVVLCSVYVVRFRFLLVALFSFLQVLWYCLRGSD